MINRDDYLFTLPIAFKSSEDEQQALNLLKQYEIDYIVGSFSEAFLANEVGYQVDGINERLDGELTVELTPQELKEAADRLNNNDYLNEQIMFEVSEVTEDALKEKYPIEQYPLLSAIFK